MSNRELLEKAAEAAGVTIMSWQLEPEKDPVQASPFTREHGFWNPLTDDGDALRLAVKLRLDVLNSEETIAQAVHHETGAYADEWAHDDRAAATRRAIVRAAAALKEKP